MSKNKQIFLAIFCALVLMFFGVQIARPNFAAHANEPVYIPISSVSDLAKIGNDPLYPLAGNYKLTSNIDFSDGVGGFHNFLPIGSVLDTQIFQISTVNNFSGVFDGDGFVIKNLPLFDKAYQYYYMGLFAKTFGAQIKNLALENVIVERQIVYPQVETNNSTLFVGGLVGLAQNTHIENCYVTFADFSIAGSTSVYAGGLVGKMFAGSLIENCYAQIDFNANISGEQASEVKIGGLVGSIENSALQVAHVSGSAISTVVTDGQIESITHSAVGGVAGFVSGTNSKIINTYVDMFLFASNSGQNNQSVVGALVGQIAPSSTPAQDNLAYAQLHSKTFQSAQNQTIVQANAFGQINNYVYNNNLITLLAQNNYEVFNNSSKWSLYENQLWNKDTLWTFHSTSLPTLQKFTQYTVELKPQETRVNLGETTAQTDVVSLQFVNNGTGVFRHGKPVEILISIISDFDVYYYLKSVEFSMITKVEFGKNNPIYSLTQLFEEDLQEKQITIQNSNKVYLLSYLMSDATQGDVSVSLEKVKFTAKVKTENSAMGLVRKRDSTMSVSEFTQELANANTYDFFAVPINSDFAFSKWVYVRDAAQGETPQQIELGDYAKFAQISFEFGISGQQDITAEILNGGYLMACFTSNVTKISLAAQFKNGQDASNAGYISHVLGGEQLDLDEILTIQKGSPITLVANPNKGYVFEGWYDGENRLLSQTAEYLFTLTEDEVTIVARFGTTETAASLTWLWIALGVIGALGLGVAIFFIIKAKTSDYSYKNFY